MRTLVKTVRDAELALLKKLGKTKDGPPLFDPKKSRAVCIYGVTRFPEWQGVCVQAFQPAWVPKKGMRRRRQGARVADGAWADQVYAVGAAVQQVKSSSSPYMCVIFKF